MQLFHLFIPISLSIMLLIGLSAVIKFRPLPSESLSSTLEKDSQYRRLYIVSAALFGGLFVSGIIFWYADYYNFPNILTLFIATMYIPILLTAWLPMHKTEIWSFKFNRHLLYGAISGIYFLLILGFTLIFSWQELSLAQNSVVIFALSYCILCYALFPLKWFKQYFLYFETSACIILFVTFLLLC